MVMLLRLLLLLLLLHLRYVVHLGIKLAGHVPLLVFATEDHYASLRSHLSSVLLFDRGGLLFLLILDISERSIFVDIFDWLYIHDVTAAHVHL